MKIYLAETNAGKELVFVDEDLVVVNDYAPTGKVDGIIDLYCENAVENLKNYFTKIEDDLNDIYSMPGERYEMNILDEYENLTLIYEE